MPRLAIPALVLLSLALPVPVLAEPTAALPDWEEVAEVGTVHVVTQDENGDSRETKIWMAVFEGEGYIRTGGSTWGENLTRNPEVVLRIEDAEYPLRVDFIEDDALREKIVTTFRAKYGWVDGALNFIRGKRPKIMRLALR